MARTQKTVLVADIGGTNSRLALADEQGALQAIKRYPNDSFRGFKEILTHFLAGRNTKIIVGCCIAIAGPVSGTTARLTNRDWQFSTTDVASCVPDLAPSSVLLINDLAALGHALSGLSKAQIDDIRDTEAREPANNQALVAGLGTGFNVCLVKDGEATPTVIEAELGHASLPANVAALLQDRIGRSVSEFDCCEALFSGRGLTRLFRVLSEGEHLDGRRILSAYSQHEPGPACETVELMADLLGVFTRELVFQYMPFRGIYFAGSAARGLLGSAARRRFLKSFEATGRLADHFGKVPLRVITDDSAALIGAAHLSTPVLAAPPPKPQGETTG